MSIRYILHPGQYIDYMSLHIPEATLDLLTETENESQKEYCYTILCLDL